MILTEVGSLASCPCTIPENARNIQYKCQFQIFFCPPIYLRQFILRLVPTFYSSIKLLISFHRFFSLLRRMFKRLLDPKAEKRPVSVLEINKYLEDRWLAKLGAEKAMNGNDRSELKTFSSSRFPIHLVDSTFVQVAPTRGTSSARPCTASTALSRRRINCFTL